MDIHRTDTITFETRQPRRRTRRGQETHDDATTAVLGWSHWDTADDDEFDDDNDDANRITAKQGQHRPCFPVERSQEVAASNPADDDELDDNADAAAHAAYIGHTDSTTAGNNRGSRGHDSDDDGDAGAESDARHEGGDGNDAKHQARQRHLAGNAAAPPCDSEARCT